MMGMMLPSRSASKKHLTEGRSVAPSPLKKLLLCWAPCGFQCLGSLSRTTARSTTVASTVRTQLWRQLVRWYLADWTRFSVLLVFGFGP